MLYLLPRLPALPELLDHSFYSPLLFPLGLRPKLEMGRLDLVAVGVHALPHIENFGLAVEVEMQSFLEELRDLSKPLPRGRLVRCNNDDVVGVARVELRPEEADAELIELVEGDVCEVLGAYVPEGYARFTFRARVDNLAKKPIKAEEVFVEIRVLFLELLEPLRDPTHRFYGPRGRKYRT